MAIVQPWLMLPTTFSLGTFTLSKNVSQKAGVWPSVNMGFTSTPGLFKSISRKVIPACFFTDWSVRTRQKIQSAYCANDVQVF